MPTYGNAMTQPETERKVGQLRHDVDDLYEIVSDMDGRLRRVAAVVDQHTLTLADHSRILDDHSRVLDDHGATLDSHTTKLDHIIELLEAN